MKKINVLKENREFNRIINTKKGHKYKNFIVYVEYNKMKYNTNNPYQFGISVSKKIGNAVVRNRLKRQIRSIIDKKRYENNFKCIIILRRGVLNHNGELKYNFKELQDELFQILNDLKLVKGENDEKKDNEK